MKYDHVVIGGGIAGLYFAYKSPGTSIVLEKSDRIGGRTLNVDFNNVIVPLGAGIGVVGKDDLLFQLLLELGISYHTGMANYESEECQEVVKKLYDNMSTIKPWMSFSMYLEATLTKKELGIFRRDNGFTDFYEADAMSTMLYYSIDENCTKYYILSVNWSEVIEKLASRVTVVTNCKAIHIDGIYPSFQVHTSQKTSLTTKSVVIATTISGIRELLLDSIYDRIQSHPFMRVYATFSGKRLQKMKKKYKHSTIVGKRSHFIIPMRENVFMVAYTDGEDAISLYREMEAEDPLKVIQKEIGYLPDDLIYSFWEEGVHYYTPGGVVDFEHLRNPERGIHVVGEAVAMSQGWVGGALETVDEIL